MASSTKPSRWCCAKSVRSAVRTASVRGMYDMEAARPNSPSSVSCSTEGTAARRSPPPHSRAKAWGSEKDMRHDTEIREYDTEKDACEI
jgi:hypothetical protein